MGRGKSFRWLYWETSFMVAALSEGRYRDGDVNTFFRCMPSVHAAEETVKSTS
jgi:hypothetical protein